MFVDMNDSNFLQTGLNGVVTLMDSNIEHMVSSILIAVGDIVGIAITVFICILFMKILRTIIWFVYDFSRGTIFIDKEKFTFLSSSYYFGIHI